MYVACFYLFYKASPKRWKTHDLPYISGMLGDTHDSPHRTITRIVAWTITVVLTMPSRFVAYGRIKQLPKLISWMLPYFVVWYFTVVSANWDAHPHSNPFRRWGISGGLVHFFFSAVFFITAGAESYYLNLERLFPGHSKQIQRFLASYIFSYCILFALNKLSQRLSWLGVDVLPLFEHCMLFAHVWADSHGTAMLLVGMDAEEEYYIELEQGCYPPQADSEQAEGTSARASDGSVRGKAPGVLLSAHGKP